MKLRIEWNRIEVDTVSCKLHNSQGIKETKVGLKTRCLYLMDSNHSEDIKSKRSQKTELKILHKAR